MDSQEKFASLNLAIVLSNGSVWDISFDDKFMAIKKKLLIQLPYKKYTTYLPFSTNLKVLNFVRNDLKRDIIQYHKKLNKQGHMTIGKSSLPIKLTDIIGTNQGFFGTGGFWKNSMESILVNYKEGIQVGNMFWVFNAVRGKHVTTVKIFECKLGSGGPRTKEVCNGGVACSLLKLGSLEKTVIASLFHSGLHSNSPFFVEKTTLYDLLPS